MKKPFGTNLRHLRRIWTSACKPASLLLVFAVSATVIASPPSSTGQSASAKDAHHWYQIGKASWYGRGFQGKRTATGERFDMNALTCAHPTLPLGSWLRVTNLRNHRSTFVRVNDRGPYGGGNIVDLSYAAARRVGLLGRSEVRVEQVRADDPALAYALLAQMNLPNALLMQHP